MKKRINSLLKSIPTFYRSHSRKAGLIATFGAGLFLVLFGTSVLNNIHLSYLRLLSQWTVKLTNSSEMSGATGFMVKGKSGKNYIMTNGHVCGLAEEGKLLAFYRGDKYLVNVVKKYQFNDLCAIEAPSTVILPVHIAYNFKEGESVFAIGHPLLEPKSITQGELSGLVGIQIAVGMNVEPKDCQGATYELVDVSNTMFSFFGVNNVCIRNLIAEASTLSILPGNSGSPVVNIFGSVVGVAFAASESGVRSYIVPLYDLKDFLKEL